MKEYTLLSLGAVIITVIVDQVSRVRLMRRKTYWFYLALFTLLMIVVNGYITHQKIVRYSSYYYCGIRMGSIPLEDFLFNFSMVTLTIIFWEVLKKRIRSQGNR